MARVALGSVSCVGALLRRAKPTNCGDVARGVAMHDVVDFRAYTYPRDVLVADGILPLTGVLTAEQVGASVGSPLIILLMVGLLSGHGGTGAHPELP